MQKIVILLGSLVLLTACSIQRKSKTLPVGETIEPASNLVLEKVFRQNLSNHAFFIQKAEIEIVSEGGNEKLVANIKYISPEKYLVSIRNRAGIEAARIYINPDTIMVNDRINRKLYCASPGYLFSKYGVSLAALPIVFGDYVGQMIGSVTKKGCENGMLFSETFIKGLKLAYTIDCEKGKAIMISQTGGTSNEGMRVKCEDFFKSNGNFVPGLISVHDTKTGTEILIRILKVETTWDGIIEFIPGSRYEIVKLL